MTVLLRHLSSFLSVAAVFARDSSERGPDIVDSLAASAGPADGGARKKGARQKRERRQWQWWALGTLWWRLLGSQTGPKKHKKNPLTKLIPHSRRWCGANRSSLLVHMVIVNGSEWRSTRRRRRRPRQKKNSESHGRPFTRLHKSALLLLLVGSWPSAPLLLK